MSMPVEPVNESTTPGDSGRVPDEPAEHSKAIRLATAALHAALASKWDSASRYLGRIHDECGWDGLNIALTAWCDTYADHATDGQWTGKTKVRVAFVDMRSGALTYSGAPDAPARIQWTGRLLAARAAMDEQAWVSLFGEIPDGEAGSYVGTVLETIARTVNGFPRGFATMGRDS